MTTDNAKIMKILLNCDDDWTIVNSTFAIKSDTGVYKWQVIKLYLDRLRLKSDEFPYKEWLQKMITETYEKLPQAHKHDNHFSYSLLNDSIIKDIDRLIRIITYRLVAFGRMFDIFEDIYRNQPKPYKDALLDVKAKAHLSSFAPPVFIGLLANEVIRRKAQEARINRGSRKRKYVELLDPKGPSLYTTYLMQRAEVLYRLTDPSEYNYLGGYIIVNEDLFKYKVNLRLPFWESTIIKTSDTPLPESPGKDIRMLMQLFSLAADSLVKNKSNLQKWVKTVDTFISYRTLLTRINKENKWYGHSMLTSLYEYAREYAKLCKQAEFIRNGRENTNK